MRKAKGVCSQFAANKRVSHSCLQSEPRSQAVEWGSIVVGWGRLQVFPEAEGGGEEEGS